MLEYARQHVCVAGNASRWENTLGVLVSFPKKHMTDKSVQESVIKNFYIQGNHCF